MKDVEFNLLKEKWIRVMRPNGEVEEVSMLELFRTAHQYRRLSGELPTQDIALLRVFLAVLHSVFSVYDPDGNFSEIQTPAAALGRWKTLWDLKAFPYEIIEAYLMHFEERFYLFHPERPFYQVPITGKSTEYTAAKLNGTLSESANKVRLFPARTGAEKEWVSYEEAARWLIYVNAFDDTSSKATTRGQKVKLPSPGAGWLGKLGLVMATGENLFETLMLNLVLAKDSANALWGSERPTWEAETLRSAERTEIPLPDNLSELYTLQSRRLLLKRDGKQVTGYLLLGGDFFPKENALLEPMTVWRVDNKKQPAEYQPRRHDPSRQMWRDFSALFVQAGPEMPPGVIVWLAALKKQGALPAKLIKFQTAGVKYGDKDFFVDDVMSDEIAIHADLLSALGGNWVSRIVLEIEYTDLLVERVGQFAGMSSKWIFMYTTRIGARLISTA